MTKPSSQEVLTELLTQADLPPAVSLTQHSGRGFDNEISTVTLADERLVVLRRYRQYRELEWPRAQFLAQHDLPTPALLAANEAGCLVEFIDGTPLGDVIKSGQDTVDVWCGVGDAYRRVHAVGFPAGLAGEELASGRFGLALVDPVEQLHRQIEVARPGLQRLLPDRGADLPALHEVVQDAAAALRTMPTAFGHGDINMWNILVASQRAVLIDRDFPGWRIRLWRSHCSTNMPRSSTAADCLPRSSTAMGNSRWSRTPASIALCRTVLVGAGVRGSHRSQSRRCDEYNTCGRSALRQPSGATSPRNSSRRPDPASWLIVRYGPSRQRRSWRVPLASGGAARHGPTLELACDYSGWRGTPGQ